MIYPRLLNEELYNLWHLRWKINCRFMVIDWIGILYLLTSSKPAREKPLETKEPRRCYLKLWSWTSTNFDRLNWTAYTPSKYFMFVSTALETANLRTTEYQPSNSTSIVVLECMKLIMCWYQNPQFATWTPGSELDPVESREIPWANNISRRGRTYWYSPAPPFLLQSFANDI